MKISEIMVQPVIVVREHTALGDVAQIMLDHGYRTASTTSPSCGTARWWESSPATICYG